MNNMAEIQSLDLDLFRNLLLDSANVGLVITHPPELDILLYNSAFRAWFPGAQEGVVSLSDLIPGLDPAEVLETLKTRGLWQREVEVKPRHRTITLQIEAMMAHGIGEGAVIVQCQNISRVKELEYMIESYSKMIEKQNRELLNERNRVERLLLNIMPETVYDEWKQFGVITPHLFEEATVLMLDFVGFTQMSVSKDPVKLIAELNDIFTAFDRIVEQFNCERLKTIGDAYMAVSGLPDPNPEHAHKLAQAGLRFLRYLEKRNKQSDIKWHCRIGINSGPVVGSVVGVQKYVYDIFGPGVNLAARLESVSNPMEITVSQSTYERIKHSFRFSDRGIHDIRGFGATQLYCLEAELGTANEDG